MSHDHRRSVRGAVMLADVDASAALGDLSESTILIVVTEGATDPENFEAIVGRSPETVGRVLTALR